MRHHLSEKLQRLNEHHKAEIMTLADISLAADPKARAKHLRELSAIHKTMAETEAMADEVPCSLCDNHIEAGKFIVVPVGESVVINRGVDLPALFKDFPARKQPKLFLCHACGIQLRIVTLEEINTGRRLDNLNEVL